MKRSEVTEIEMDILEAFIDLGTTEDNPEPIKWLRQIITSDYNRETNQSVNKQFMEGIPLIGLTTQKARKDEMEKEGLNYDEALKIFFVGKDFRDKEFEPREWDRVDLNNVYYDIVKIKPTPLALVNVLYTVFLVEAPLSAQTEIYRELVDPFFEIDGSQDESDTNTSHINDDLPGYSNIGDNVVEIGAFILGTVMGPFVIETGINDLVKILYEEQEYTFTITGSNWSASALSTYLQTLFDNNIGENKFIISAVNGKIEIRTVAVGLNVYFDLISIDSRCYDVLGLTTGRYFGNKLIRSS